MPQTLPKLTDEQIQQMDHLGFVILEDLFSAEEVAELEKHLTAFHLAKEEAMKRNGGDGMNRPGEILFSWGIAEEDVDVYNFTKNDKMKAIATQLLGPNVDLYWNQTVYKNPETNKIFPWHQDDAYGPVEPSPYLTCWLAISDATTENGCISVLPGSHKDGLRPHEKSDIGLVGHPADHPDQGIQVPIKSGSMILFWSTVLHKSGPNLSDGMRKAYIMQYAAHGLKFIEPGKEMDDLLPIARES